MDDQTLNIFQHEVERQCRFGLMSISLLNAAHAGVQQAQTETESIVRQMRATNSEIMDSDNPARELVRARDAQERRRAAQEQVDEEREHYNNQRWYAIQNFLIAAGNLSKLLWGTRAGADNKTWANRVRDRQQLRASLGVADNSVLKLSPEFRNHFEHMDERVEQWAAETTSHIVVLDSIGPASAIGGVDSRDCLRSYNPADHTLAFRGQLFEIIPVVQAIERLLPKATAAVNARPHWADPMDSQSPNTSGGGQ